MSMLLTCIASCHPQSIDLEQKPSSGVSINARHVAKMLVDQQQISQHTLVKISDLLFSKLSVALDSCRRSVEASRGLLFQTQANDGAVIDLHPMELERLLLDLRGQAFKTNVS